MKWKSFSRSSERSKIWKTSWNCEYSNSSESVGWKMQLQRAAGWEGAWGPGRLCGQVSPRSTEAGGQPHVAVAPLSHETLPEARTPLRCVVDSNFWRIRKASNNKIPKVSIWYSPAKVPVHRDLKVSHACVSTIFSLQPFMWGKALLWGLILGSLTLAWAVLLKLELCRKSTDSYSGMNCTDE